MNVGGIILLVAIMLVCLFEVVQLIRTIVKKRKERKALIEKKSASVAIDALEDDNDTNKKEDN